MRKLLILFAVLAAVPASAQFNISQLPAANLPVQPTDALIINQTVSGAKTTRQAPVSAVTSLSPPLTAPYLLQSANAGIPNSRTLVGTANEILLADGGPLGNLVLSTPQPIGLLNTPTFAGMTLNGLLTINSVGSGYGLEIEATAANNAKLSLAGNANAPGTSDFLLQQNSSNDAFVFNLAAGNLIFGTSNSTRGRIAINGGFVVGAPAGDTEGAGSINAQSVFVNGVAASTLTLANPSALVGLTAVNGVATTAMRSDAAPALDQSISPTMTGTWTFTPSAGGTAINVNAFNSSSSKALTLNGSFTGAGTTGLLTLTDLNNTNGVGILMTGNGATTPSKFFRVNNGSYQILNNAFSTVLLQLTDAGVMTLGAPLPAASGGTSFGTYTLGDTLYSSAANTLSKLAGNTTATKNFLTQTGTGAVSASPAWGTIAAADLPGGFSGFANPSGLIGLTAVNGVATTGDRSDSTHALDQSISPTWTGTHTFSAAPNFNLGFNGTFNQNTSLGGSLTNTSTGLSASTSYSISNGTNSILEGLTGVNNVTPFFTGGPASQHMFFGSGGAIPLSIGTGGNERVRISAVGNLVLNPPTSGISLIVNTSAAANTALSIASTTAATQAYEQFVINGTIQAFLGSAGTTNDLVTGSAAGDLIVRTQGTNFLLSTNSGSSVNAIKATTAGAVSLPGLAATSAAQTGTVCWSSTGGLLTVDTTLACLSSTVRIKQALENLDVGLAEVMRLRPISYTLKPEFNPYHLGRQVGLIAEEVQKVDPRLVALDDEGKPRGVRYMQLTALLTRAIQVQQYQIYALWLGLAASFGFTFWRTRAR